MMNLGDTSSSKERKEVIRWKVLEMRSLKLEGQPTSLVISESLKKVGNFWLRGCCQFQIDSSTVHQ